MNHSVSTMSGKTKVKVVFLGNQSVGKSSIIQKYIHDKFDQTCNPTVGIDFLAKNLSLKGKNYRLQLWDTAGQQRFRSLIPSYLKDAHCALIVFDVTNAQTLNAAYNWLTLYKDNRAGQGNAVLVGNKIDLAPRQVTRQIGEQKAQELGIKYFQISAKTGQNIDDLFASLLESCTEKPVTSMNNIPAQKKQTAIIKQQRQDQPEITKAKQQEIDQTAGKIVQNQKKKQPQKQKPVVLKNQKINEKQKKKGCC